MASAHRSLGLCRYAFSVQYHGLSFLGFSKGAEEDCILADGKTDLRGYRSIESRLCEALSDLVGNDDWESLQVSSRTDRGVHALKNTCHVDIRQKQGIPEDWSGRLHRGLNFLLRQQKPWFAREQERKGLSRKRHRPHSRLGDYWIRHDPMNDLRVLQVKPAPISMPNPYHEEYPNQPATVDWNARFSATERTYLYRILYSTGCDMDWAATMEWDRSWRIHESTSKGLDIEKIKDAASFLVGEHDFSSFRAKGCQRSSPIVDLKEIAVRTQPYGGLSCLGLSSSEMVSSNSDLNGPGESCELLTLLFRGNSFLYRQVRNMTGCLVEVGLGRRPADSIPNLLAARDRTIAPMMAPPHGLFLVDVQHGDFKI